MKFKCPNIMAMLYINIEGYKSLMNEFCAWLAPPVGTSVMVNEWTLFLEWNIFSAC